MRLVWWIVAMHNIVIRLSLLLVFGVNDFYLPSTWVVIVITVVLATSRYPALHTSALLMFGVAQFGAIVQQFDLG